MSQGRSFPQEMENSKNYTHCQTGKQGSDEVYKFRQISLLASGGKVLEKILTNTINHNVYTIVYMNENQFGFRPQKSTVDVAMARRDFVQTT
jgi:hypothetical protein